MATLKPSKPLWTAALIAILTFASALAFAESPNPFTSSGGPSRAAAPASREIALLAPLLRGLTDRLAELAGQVRDARSPGPMFALALVSLLYGIFHALGPGHGKTIISTFFLAKDAKLRHSLMAGFLMALIHAVSAITIVFALFFIVRGVFSIGFENASKIVQTVSFGVIALIGAVMLVQRIRGKEHTHAHGRSHGHGHEHELEREVAGGMSAANASEFVSAKDLWGIALTSGVVPCPGASAIILVCLSMNVMLAGVVAVTMISIGMGVTVSAIGAVAILVKRGVLKASSAKGGSGSRIARRIVEIAGSLILFVFGLVFFVAQF
jgi:ABC-type nickel/cobalt efflux system permease component RcnA